MPASATPSEITAALRQAAIDEGFTMCGIAPAVTASGFSDLVRWIDAGYAGQMDYIPQRRDAYRHPDGVMPGARTIVALAYPYPAAADAEVADGHGRIARYVWSGVDYHDTIHPKLKRLRRLLLQAVPTANCRGVIDTAPLLEREFAQLAGLGWQGKNTLLLNRQLGSYFFLACLLTDIELTVDAPHNTAHCGTCTACLQACPTAAFVQPGVLDATRCISYLTIEHRDPIAPHLRPLMGDWLFGCDVCQEVCPWNRKPARRQSKPADAFAGLELSELFSLSEDQFRERFRKTPLWRTRRRGILRNAAIVLGNQRHRESTGVLTEALADPEAMVRGAAAWALGQIGGPDAAAALHTRRSVETEPEVQREIDAAISRSRGHKLSRWPSGHGPHEE